LNSPAWFVHGGGGPGATAATTMITKATIPTTATVTTPTTMIPPHPTPMAAATVPILSMRDLVHQVPLVVQQRKVHSIEPGSSQDPVLNLLRYVKPNAFDTHKCLSRSWLPLSLSCDYPITISTLVSPHNTHTHTVIRNSPTRNGVGMRFSIHPNRIPEI
jgi:hypothetical protein